MPRESTIQILRSTGTDVPTGLTFGELAYSDVNEKLFVGDAAGNSIWVGAQVTAGSISTNSEYIIPTQSAVKTYVDGAIGGGSGVVNTVNATGGAITITGDGGAISNTQVGKANTIGVRLATTSLTGVASFNSTYFSVANGAVSLVGAYQVTGDSVQAGQGINLSANKTIGNIGVITFNGATGTVLYTPPIASTSLTGVASFSSDNFAVSAQGVVTVKDGGIANAELVNSSITIKAGSGEAGQAISLGSSFSITGTANQVAVSRSTSEFTIGLPNDITIPGNLTVNGTVVTANVDSFIVEDPLIMLGTGNAADSVDLGFYGQYTSSGKRFAGIFRDASDSGKFKFFTGLSGGVEPTTFVNDAGSGYTVATLVAKIDGGTF